MKKKVEKETKEIEKENKKEKRIKKDKKKEKVTKKSRKNNLTKLETVINFLDKNRKIIYGFIFGALISAIVAAIIWPERIATLADGTQPVAEIAGEKITADKIYESVATNNKVNNLLNIIDEMILTEKYEETEEMKKEIEEEAQNYYDDAKKQYNVSESDFLKQYGYKNHEEFIKDLKLNHLREKYYEEYVESLVSDKEINDYYEKKVYGDIDSKHMLVAINEEQKDEDAKKLANEIIAKLKEGKSFDEVKEEYKDKITYEELGYLPFNANIQESYMTAIRNLENGKYTTEPVKTSYGYHVIYRIDQKEKPTLEDIKDTIVDDIASTKKQEDQNLYAKSLIEFRKEKELKFNDTSFEEEYKNYIDSVK